MAVIPESQMVLMRTRKELHQLIKTCQWDKISRIEKQLFNRINEAVEDANRSPKALLSELASVIAVYKELSILCRLYSQQRVLG